MLIVRGVNLFPTQIEEQLLSFPTLAPHYELKLTRCGRMDSVQLIVECRDDQANQAATAEAVSLAKSIKATIGISVEVNVEPSGSIPRSLGKAARVTDLRPKD